MSRYQKQSGNATYWRKQRLIKALGIRLLIMLVWLSWALPSSSTPLQAANPVFAPDLAQLQTSGARFAPLLITPEEPTPVLLQVHTADFYLDDSTGSLLVTVDARYRLKNNDKETIATVVLRVAPMPGVEEMAPIDGLTLTADNQAIDLFPTDNGGTDNGGTGGGNSGGYTAQVQIGADARSEIQLTYTVDLQQQKLPLLDYVTVALDQWQGTPSLRIMITMPATIPQSSWLRIGPEGWHFTADSAARIGAKWLYDAQQPNAPFIFQFVHPNLWSQIDPLTQRVQSDGTVADFLQLGDLYQQLVMAATEENASGAIRERFYAQALAAYTTGIERLATTAPPGELAMLYIGMATLYRGQITEEAGEAYAIPLTDAIQAALNRLPQDDLRRRELTQWLADGLQRLLTEAQGRQDWQSALRLTDQLSALPSDIVDSVTLAQTKRLLIVQQALQLLEQDNRVAAAALAGDEISDGALQPPPSADTLFSRWEVTVTVSPQQQQMEIVGQPVPVRLADAKAAFSSLATLWQSAPGSEAAIESTVVGEVEPHLRMIITAPTTQRFDGLVTLIPPRADWALLRTLLQQIKPTVAEERTWLNRQWTITQTLDLQAAGEQWQAMSDTLERQATQFEQESAAFITTDTTGAENALRARIQAANYRSAAHQWQKLMHNSWVAVQFMGQTREQTRTWLLTAATPAQQLTLVAQSSAVVGVVSITVLAFIGLFLLTTLLWWLL